MAHGRSGDLHPPIAGDSRPDPAPAPHPGILRKYAQFAVVGLGNAVVDIGVLNVLLLLLPTRSAIGLAAENSLAVALAIANSYYWNTRWTFRQEADRSLRQRVLFLIQSLLNIGLNDAVLLLAAAAASRIDLGPAWLSVNLSKGVAMFAASSMSFGAMRLFVFRPHV